MPTVNGVVSTPVGVVGGTVTAQLVGTVAGQVVPVVGFFSTGGNREIVTRVATTAADATGAWSLVLPSNLDPNLSPANTYYQVTEIAAGSQSSYYVQVPNGAGPYWVGNILVQPTTVAAPIIGIQLGGDIGGTVTTPLVKGLARVVNVTDAAYGADPTGVVDATSAINSALTAGAGGTVYAKGTFAISGAGLSIPPTTNFTMDPQSQLVYTGTGTAVTIDGGATEDPTKRSVIALRLKRSVLGWGGGGDTTSTGVLIRNMFGVRLTAYEIQQFETGIEIRGDGTGCTDIELFLGRIVNNRRGIRATHLNSGWSNDTNIWGGVIRIDGGLGVSLTGSRGLDLSDSTANGWTIVATNLENNAVEENLTVGGTSHLFLNCRYDTITKVHLLSTSAGNQIVGGFGNYGPGTAVFQDDSSPRQNVIVGSRGMLQFSDTSSGSPQNGGRAAYEAQPLNGTLDVLFRGRNISGQVTYEVDGTGTYRMYVPGDAFARLLPATSGGPGAYGYFGFGRGNAGVDTLIGRTSDNQAGFAANVPIVRKVAAQTFAGGALNLDVSQGEVFPITLTGNVTSFSMITPVTNSGGQASSQVLTVEFIQDATGSRTLSSPSANIKWAGSAPTLTTTANRRDAFTFRYDGTNFLEIGRSMNVG